MTFDEAEARFRELQARVQRGEPISRAEYEDQVSQLAVQDDRGVLWEINPRTGKWMYFDGAEWVGGIPPGRDTSTVMPLPRGPGAPSGVSPSGVGPSSVRPAAPMAPPPSPPSHAAPPPPAAIPPLSTRLNAPTAPRTAVPMTTSPRPVVSPATPAQPPRVSPPSPEAVPPYRRVGPEQAGGPPPAEAPAPGGEAKPKRAARQGPLGGPNREWVPLAIGAVVLLFCAVLLFVGGRFVLSIVGGPTPTPTRPTLAPLPTNTAVPTVMRLPTQPLPPAQPAPVLAKVNEASVNVRGTPSTSGKIVGKLKKENSISLTGRSVDGQWYQATVQGVTGPAWVFAATLDIVSGDPSTLPLAGPGAPTPTRPAAPAPGAGGAATPTATVIGAH